MALTNLTKVQTVGIGSNIEVVGVVTTGQFKSGTSNLHSSGVELTNLNVSGIATIGGNLSIGGTLTYEDVTNIDSIGIVTARAGVNVSGGQLDVGSNIKLGNAGVVTATSFVGSSGLNVLDGRVKIGTTSNTPASANEPGIVFGDNTAGTATKGIASFCANGAAPLLLTRRVSDGNVLGIADDTTTRGMLRVTSNDLEITAIEELRLSTGAGHNEKIRLTNAGRFGLGVTGPDAMLHVKGSDNVLGVFESTDADSLIQFKDNSTSDTILMGALGGDDLLLRCDAGNIVFHVANNNEKLRIDTSGRLLVNTTSTNQNVSKIVVKASSPSDTYDNHIYLEGSETSGDANTGGVLGFGGHDGGGSFRNWANIWGVKENSTDGNTASYMAFHTRAAGGNPAEKLRITSTGNILLQPYNPGSSSFYPYMSILNGQIKKYMQVKILNSGQGTKFTFTGTDRTSALITVKVSHSWTASNTGNRHGSAIFAAKFFTQNGGSAGWGGITLIQSDGYSTGNFILSNESGYGYSIKVNNPLSDSGISFCYDIEIMSASNTSKHSLTSVAVV